ncbi:hypothetical protein, partial [Pseudomonas savastanoi]|uniref:hypothetical protein n=1 Tax=Pseudomonas savastanoi TaxID=29438 RepID=UPI00196A0F00
MQSILVEKRDDCRSAPFRLQVVTATQRIGLAGMIQCYASRSLLNVQRSTIFSKFCGLPYKAGFELGVTEIGCMA